MDTYFCALFIERMMKKLTNAINKNLDFTTKEQFTVLYKKYSKAVYLNIKKIIRDESTAMDVLQNVFIKLWENRLKLQEKEILEGWLFTVSYRESISVLRKNMKIEIKELHENLHEIEAEEIDEEQFHLQLQVVHEAVKLLSPKKKEIFMLSRFEGKSNDEIVQLTNLSKEAIKTHILQANKIIKRYISIKYPHLVHSAFFFYLSLC